MGAHLTNKTNFYGIKLNSYEQLIKVVGALAPSAHLIPPMYAYIHYNYEEFIIGQKSI